MLAVIGCGIPFVCKSNVGRALVMEVKERGGHADGVRNFGDVRTAEFISPARVVAEIGKRRE